MQGPGIPSAGVMGQHPMQLRMGQRMAVNPNRQLTGWVGAGYFPDWLTEQERRALDQSGADSGMVPGSPRTTARPLRNIIVFLLVPCVLSPMDLHGFVNRPYTVYCKSMLLGGSGTTPDHELWPLLDLTAQLSIRFNVLAKGQLNVFRRMLIGHRNRQLFKPGIIMAGCENSITVKVVKAIRIKVQPWL